MIVGQGEIHHGSNLDLAVDSDGPVLDGMKTKYRTLGQVDNGRTHKRTKDAPVTYGERTAGHVLYGQLAVPGLSTQVSMYDYIITRGLDCPR